MFCPIRKTNIQKVKKKVSIFSNPSGFKKENRLFWTLEAEKRLYER